MAKSKIPNSDDKYKNARVSQWYDEIANSVDKCVFCDLRDKYILDKRGDVVLTVSLYPYVDGHLLIIPRRHIEKFRELNDEEWSDIHELIKIGFDVINKEFGIDNTNVLYREGGKSSGKSVGHLHLHVFPVTSEFMKYSSKEGFVWRYQKIQYGPFQMAERLRRHIINPDSKEPKTNE